MYHLPLLPGTNVALINAMAHVVRDRRAGQRRFRARALRGARRSSCGEISFIEERNSPEAAAKITGVPAEKIRGAARLYATGGNAVIYYGLGVTEHSQGSTTVLAMANLAMATGNLGREGVGVNPLRGQNNVQGSCDMGSFPHELTGYRHISDPAMRGSFEEAWGVTLDPEPGLRIPNMFDAALDGSFRGHLHRGRGHRAVRPQHASRDRRAGRDGIRHRPRHLLERDREVRARFSSRLVVPGKERHFHQLRAAHLARAQGDAAAGRQGRLGSHVRAFATRSAIRWSTRIHRKSWTRLRV